MMDKNIFLQWYKRILDLRKKMESEHDFKKRN